MDRDDNVSQALYAEHLRELDRRWSAAMAFAGFDAAIVIAGRSRNYFLDDQAPPLKLNPHFLQWCPMEAAEGSALLIRPGGQPRLYFLREDDYWHQPPSLPDWTAAFDVHTFADEAALQMAVSSDARSAGNHLALIGEALTDPLPGIPDTDVNPTLLLDHLHYHRAVKTAFELDCMRTATRKAVRGHLAARDAFFAGASEFEINLAYLAASGQLPAELPYPSIVALNEHAGVLHYQHYDRAAPSSRRSFLIDAGGSHLGYAADITRTYPATGREAFADLIERLDAAQQALIADMRAGQRYLDLHIAMHRRLAEVLAESGIATASPEAVFEAGLTETFLPHGLGHLIGLQTHDVGGQQAGPEGGENPPPENYPALRLTRTLAAHMPVTIEPGLYFIPQLLAAARDGDRASLIDWQRVEALAPCGGIRIEDNVVIGEDGLENLTRDAFAELDASQG